MVLCQLYGVSCQESGDSRTRRRRGETETRREGPNKQGRSSGIANCEFKNKESGDRSQNSGEKEQKRISFTYWILATRFLPWALRLYTLFNPQSAIYNLKSTPPRT